MVPCATCADEFTSSWMARALGLIPRHVNAGRAKSITYVTAFRTRSQKSQDCAKETTGMYSNFFHAGKLVVEVSRIAGNYYFWALVWDWTVGTTDSSRFNGK